MTYSETCEKCGVRLTPYDTVPCKDVPDCPAPIMFVVERQMIADADAEIAGDRNGPAR